MEFKVTGVEDIDRKLADLEGAIAKKIFRKAIREAARPMLQQVKANAPVGSGELKKSIKLRAIKRSRVSFGMRIGTDAGDYQGKQYYAPMVELGHKHGKRGLPNRKQIPGRHFIRKAFKDTAQSVKDDALKLILEGIEQHLKGQQ